eukprot:2515901-Pleurochrysis_carterae.AAC.1
MAAASLRAYGSRIFFSIAVLCPPSSKDTALLPLLDFAFMPAIPVAFFDFLADALMEGDA